MRTIDFSFNGGFPLDQRTLNDKQSAYLDILYALTGFLQIPAVGSHIMYGCNIVGPNITPGMMFIDGELCSFAGAIGNVNTKIKKTTVIENAPFENGTNNPVYKNTIAVVDPAGIAYSDFNNYGPALVFDANYNHIDNNFTDALLQKLNEIQAGAQVNVSANWTAVFGQTGFIVNKPLIPEVLRQGFKIVGDVVGGDSIITCNFPTVETSDYLPVFVPISLGNADTDNNLIFIARNLTPTSFDLSAQEVYTGTNNIRIDFILFKK